VKQEKPAEGILKKGVFGDSIWYYVPCDCDNHDHAHTIGVEADAVEVSVHIYTKVTTPFWSINRWKQMWRLLTRGYLEYEAVTVLNKQQAENYSAALSYAVKDVEKLRKQHK